MYRQWELLEFSLVGIAANPEATMLAISKKVSPQTWATLEALRHSFTQTASRQSVATGTSAAAGTSSCSYARTARALSSAEIAAVISAQLSPCDMDALVTRSFDLVAGRLG